MVSLIITLGVMAVNPCDSSLVSNMGFSFSVYDPVGSHITRVGGYCAVAKYSFSNDLNNGNNLPSGSYSGTQASGFQIPDWLNSGLSWITKPLSVGLFVVNLIGAPYTLVASFGIDSNLTAIIGAAFSVLNLFFIISWVLGKDY